jgi:hypothetical protein
MAEEPKQHIMVYMYNVWNKPQLCPHPRAAAAAYGQQQYVLYQQELGGEWLMERPYQIKCVPVCAACADKARRYSMYTVATMLVQISDERSVDAQRLAREIAEMTVPETPITHVQHQSALRAAFLVIEGPRTAELPPFLIPL